MKKEGKKEFLPKIEDNSCGTVAVTLGILSIAFASAIGIVLAIIALFFANKQKQIKENSWSKAGKILSIIGIVVGVLSLIVVYFYLKNLGNLGGLYGLP